MAVRFAGLSLGRTRRESRQESRHPVTTVSCELGRLVDLSQAGMRVRCKAATPLSLGQCVTLHLHHRSGTIEACALVRWVRRVGLREREIGLQFSFAREDDARARQLDQLARFGFVSPDRGGRALPAEPVLVHAELPDYYAELGIASEASPDAVRQAFRAQVKLHHPDVGGDLDRFMKVHRAWEVLQDPAARRSYDQARLRSA